MPEVTEIYSSTHLSCADLKNAEVTLRIAAVEVKEFDDDGRKVSKPVITFEGYSKTFVANKTNTMTIAEITGKTNTDHWVGSWVTLYPTMVPFGSRTVEAVRIRAASLAQLSDAAQAPVQTTPAAPVQTTPAAAVQPTAQPVAQQEVQPVVQPVTQQEVQPATQPVTQPAATQPVAQQEVQPAVRPATNPQYDAGLNDGIPRSFK